MKRQRHGKQVLAVLLAFCLFLPAVFSTPAAVPAADTGLNSQMTPEEQQSYLEMKLRQTEKTLETLGKQSKEHPGVSGRPGSEESATCAVS